MAFKMEFFECGMSLGLSIVDWLRRQTMEIFNWLHSLIDVAAYDEIVNCAAVWVFTTYQATWLWCLSAAHVFRISLNRSRYQNAKSLLGQTDKIHKFCFLVVYSTWILIRPQIVDTICYLSHLNIDRLSVVSACDLDQAHNGCRIDNGACSCSYGCKSEFRYASLKECTDALKVSAHFIHSTYC